jgi:HK97 gp10 family phage protein
VDGFDLDVSELNKVAVALDRSAGQVGARGAQVLRKTALDIEATAKQFAPVDTGALRNSIGHDLLGDGRYGVLEAEIGPTVEYAPYVEFGTSRRAPAAFMGPALDRHVPDFITALEQLGGEVL